MNAIEKENQKLREEVLRLQLIVEKQGEWLKDVADLIGESEGVYGLHLNGAPSPWDEIRTGGHFEEWLIDFDDAINAEHEPRAACAAFRREFEVVPDSCISNAGGEN
jgi:hypothetical protein